MGFALLNMWSSQLASECIDFLPDSVNQLGNNFPVNVAEKHSPWFRRAVWLLHHIISCDDKNPLSCKISFSSNPSLHSIVFMHINMVELKDYMRERNFTWNRTI
jgi:hypothetical protein